MDVDVYDEGLVIDGKKVRVFSETDVKKINWKDCDAEYIISS